MIPKLTVYATYLYYLMVLIVEIRCFSQDVQLLSACSDKFLTVQNDRIFANQNSESPQNFTIQSHQYTKQNMAPDIRITFYVKERGAYICFNQKWQPRLMKRRNLKDEHSCHFREAMDHGYSTFSSVKDPQKYLGFMKNGRPINYDRIKNDEKCRRIFKRIIENSSNDVISNSAIVAYQETSTLSSALGNRKSSSSRIQQKTHSNKNDMSKPRNVPRAKGGHPVRHHHNESPLRHPHHQQNNINSNNNSRFNDSFSSNSSSRNTKQLDNENFNTIYNNPSNNVNSNNNISDNNEKVTTHHIRHQHHRKMHHQQQQSVSDVSPTNDPEDQHGFVTNHDEKSHNNENINRNYNRDNWNKDEIDFTDNNSNNNSNNSTSNCSSDDSENDKHLKGKKNVRGRNAHANEKQQNNKCNNRKSKKNNENVRHSRKSNQKNSHKINRTPEN